MATVRHRYGTRNYALDHAPTQGFLWVNCWCERGVYLVLERLIGEATQSCGHPKCTPPDRP